MQAKRLIFGLTAAVFMVLSCISPVQAQDVKEASTDTLMKHVQALSSERYQGRLAGTEGYFDATEYVINELSHYGVKPYKGEWTQLFQIECNEIESASLYTHSMRDNSTEKYVLGNDFVCAATTGSGYTNSPAAFCGYGFDHESYNEYKGIDVKGKVVIVLSGVPSHVAMDIADQYSTIKAKANVAKKHGAHALVVVNMSKTCAPDEVQLRTFTGEGEYLDKFPVLIATRNTGNALLDGEPRSFEECVKALSDEKTMQSFLMDKKIEININAHHSNKALTANVVGVLPGFEKPMSNEFIVVGAHLDHVGAQGTTCMFPGADDNATGVAAVLETARLLSLQQYEPAKRSILFLFFSGGEQQSLGSRVFLSNFKPLKNIEAFINAECIGGGDSIAVMGNKRFPAIYAIADSLDQESTKMMVHGFETMPTGDATAFTHIGIPSLVFSTLNGNKHVHTPSDIAEDVDRNMLTKCATLMFKTVYELSWGDYQGRSRRSKATKF